jgi:hypothetical protein
MAVSDLSPNIYLTTDALVMRGNMIFCAPAAATREPVVCAGANYFGDPSPKSPGQSRV